MDFEENIVNTVQTMIMEIMAILHKNNIKQVHMGGLLRLLGVEEELAQQSDNEYIELDEDFAKYIAKITETNSVDSSNQLLH